MKNILRSGYSISTVISLFLAINSFAITDALKIKIAYGTYSDEIAIRFMSGATAGFDGCCDAWKLFSPNTAVPNLFTKTNIGEELAINALPEFTSSSSVEVFVRIGVAATYSVSAEELGAFAPDVCIKMQDVVTGQIYDLRTTNIYSISLPVTATTAPARFIVFFSYPASIQTSDVSCQGCSDGSATVTKAGATNWQYSLVNSSGSSIATGTSSLSALTLTGLAAGNYSVTISSGFSCSEIKAFTISGPITYYSAGNGNWENISSWTTASCSGAPASSLPAARDNIVICAGTNITLNANTSFNSITINGSLTANASIALTGNWTNNGIFTANTYTVTFNGNALQTIGGSTTSIFNHLTINNAVPAKAVQLNAPVTVNGVFALQHGHIITSSVNILTCGPNSSIQLLSTPQDSSFVKGPMRHTVNVSSGVTKIFPVGKDNAYRRVDLTIDQKTSATTTYTAEVINSSAAALGYSLPPTISNVSEVRYNEITQSPSSTKLDMAQVVMYFGCTGGNDMVKDMNKTSVAKDNGSGSWIDLTSTPWGFTCQETYYWGNELSGTFTSFSGTKFALTNTGSPTPPTPLSVTLLNFDAERSGQDNILCHWTTASETNSDYFEIQRLTTSPSPNGEGNWAPIGTVKAAGNSSTNRNYEFADAEPPITAATATFFYRLKSVNSDGSFQYSKIVSVNFENETTVAVYPNPASEYLRVRLPEKKNSELNIILYNTLGKKCLSETITTITDNENILLDFRNKLKPGMYVLAASCNNTVYQRKIIIK